MKKYRPLVSYSLIVALGFFTVLALVPKILVMPSLMLLCFLAIVAALIGLFLVFMWRENPEDEREAHNQARASRLAYVVGCVSLIAVIIVQTLNQDLNSELPIILFIMVATKVLIQSFNDRQ